jgi:hypothetical protein
VFDGVGVFVGVCVGVWVAARVGVLVAVWVGVLLGVLVGVRVAVGVAVGVGVAGGVTWITADALLFMTKTSGWLAEAVAVFVSVPDVVPDTCAVKVIEPDAPAGSAPSPQATVAPSEQKAGSTAEAVTVMAVIPGGRVSTISAPVRVNPTDAGA